MSDAIFAQLMGGAAPTGANQPNAQKKKRRAIDDDGPLEHLTSEGQQVVRQFENTADLLGVRTAGLRALAIKRVRTQGDVNELEEAGNLGGDPTWRRRGPRRPGPPRLDRRVLAGTQPRCPPESAVEGPVANSKV